MKAKRQQVVRFSEGFIDYLQRSGDAALGPRPKKEEANTGNSSVQEQGTTEKLTAKSMKEIEKEIDQNA